MYVSDGPDHMSTVMLIGSGGTKTPRTVSTFRPQYSLWGRCLSTCLVTVSRMGWYSKKVTAGKLVLIPLSRLQLVDVVDRD